MFSMKSIKKRILGFSNSEKGFTLIEIIAVLVILGILAAVAIPRFTNLQQDAREKATQAALAEAKARSAQQFASELLIANGNTSIVNGTTVAANINANYGDFTVTNTSSAASIVFTVTQVQGVATTANNSDTWFTP